MSTKSEQKATTTPDEMTDNELDGAAGGNPISAVIGAVAGATGLTGVGDKVEEVIDDGKDAVTGAVSNVAGQIMSKRKGR